MRSTPDESLAVGSYYYLSDPVAIESCDFTGVHEYFVYDGGKGYYLASLTVSDCRIELATESCSNVFRFNNGLVLAFTMEDCTVWETGASRDYFLR